LVFGDLTTRAHPQTQHVADTRGNVRQWLFLADETAPGISSGGGGGSGGEQLPNGEAAAAVQVAAPEAAPRLLAVELTGPQGLVDFVDPSDDSSLLGPVAAAPLAAPPGKGLAAGPSRRASGPLPLATRAVAGGGGTAAEPRLLRLRNLVLSGSGWSNGAVRLVNAKGGETLDVMQLSLAKARAQAPALVEWACTGGGELRGLQEQLRSLVSS
jgi:hypothetical protein